MLGAGQAVSGFLCGKMCWQKPRLGLVLVCPCGAMAMHQGSPLATGSLWSFYIKPSFFLPPAGLVCQGHVPVPLPALPQASWQGSMSSTGTTVSRMENWAAISPPCAHPKDISRPSQPDSSASETATGSKTGQLAIITLNYHKSSSILPFLPLLPPELCSLINRNRTFLSPLIASSNISCLEG